MKEFCEQLTDYPWQCRVLIKKGGLGSIPQCPGQRVGSDVHNPLVIQDENPGEGVCWLWARGEKKKSADCQAIHACIQDNNNVRLTWTDKDEQFPLDNMATT